MNHSNPFNLLLSILFHLGLTSFLLADGNMKVEVRNGNLKVTGQNNTAQKVEVIQTGPFSFLFTSSDGTQFNGMANLTISGVTGNVQFDLKSGRKVLELHPAPGIPLLIIGGNLKISSSGNATVNLFLTSVRVFGQADISTKNGNDNVILGYCDFRERVRIKSGNGESYVYAGFTNFGKQFQSSLGNGDDILFFHRSNLYGLVEVRMGGGNDLIEAWESTFVASVFNGDRGIDEFITVLSLFLTDPILKSIEFIGP